jgi:neutral ceramidase
VHKSFFYIAAVGLTAFAGVGCSGDSSSNKSRSSATAASTVSSSLAILATVPVDTEQDVAVGDPLFVTFDAEVDPNSLVSGAVELRSDVGLVSAVVQLATPRVVSITPDAPLSSATAHLLRITPAVSTLAGKHLPADVLIQFKTSATAIVIGPGTGTVPPSTPGTYTAGVATADLTPWPGVPLAGFGGGDRRHSPFPDLNPFNDYTFLNPATGTLDPVMAKALVIDNGTERVCVVTLDLIATEAAVVQKAHQKAAALGFTIPLEKVMVCASHTHSGPGAISKKLVWQVIAADLHKNSVSDHITAAIAQAMIDAETAMQPVSIGVGNAQVVGATRNRRHSDSPNLNVDSVDTEMVVVRVDTANGTPLASVWNFAVHGTHFGDSNLKYSADIMGSATNKAEAQGAGVCLFVNGAEGDIKPKGDYDVTGQILADGILAARQAAQTSSTGVLQSVYEMVDMGQPYLGVTIASVGGSIASNSFVQGMLTLGINPTLNVKIPNGLIEREFRYQAIRIGKTVIASMPGEPIHEMGLILKADGRGMGYDYVIPAGLANGHGSYFTTPTEYGFGGYEGMASLFGPQGGVILMDSCRRLMDRLKP